MLLNLIESIGLCCVSMIVCLIQLFLTFLTFRHRLPVRGSLSRGDLSVVPCQRPILPFSLMLHAFRSLLTVSFHLNFGLPLGRFHFTYISATARMFSVSSRLSTCSNHCSHLLLMTIAIGSTFAASNIASFLRCSLADIGHVSQQ